MVVAPSSAAHVVAVLRLALVVEAVVHRGGPEAVVHRGLFWGVPAPSRCGAFGLLYHGGLKKLLELTADPSSLRGRGLGHRSD